MEDLSDIKIYNYSFIKSKKKYRIYRTFAYVLLLGGFFLNKHCISLCQERANDGLVNTTFEITQNDKTEEINTYTIRMGDNTQTYETTNIPVEMDKLLPNTHSIDIDYIIEDTKNIALSTYKDNTGKIIDVDKTNVKSTSNMEDTKIVIDQDLKDTKFNEYCYKNSTRAGLSALIYCCILSIVLYGKYKFGGINNPIDFELENLRLEAVKEYNELLDMMDDEDFISYLLYLKHHARYYGILSTDEQYYYYNTIDALLHFTPVEEVELLKKDRTR